jgi:hypothetical protein
MKRTIIAGLAALVLGACAGAQIRQTTENSEAVKTYEALATQCEKVMVTTTEKYAKENWTRTLSCKETIASMYSISDLILKVDDAYNALSNDEKNNEREKQRQLRKLISDLEQNARRYYDSECSFCENMTIENCGQVDEYLTLIEKGYEQIDRIGKSVEAMNCNQKDEASFLIDSYLQGVRDFEDTIDVVNLTRGTIAAVYRTNFWRDGLALQRKLAVCGGKK